MTQLQYSLTDFPAMIPVIIEEGIKRTMNNPFRRRPFKQLLQKVIRDISLVQHTEFIAESR